MLTGRLSATDTDLTPYPNGKLGGAAWTLIEHSDPVAWTNLGTFVDCPPADMITRVSWEVRGVEAGSTPILSVGQAWVENVDGDSAIVGIVETFTDARVEFHVDGSSTVLRVQSHLAEDWYFQAKVAYDVYEASPL